MFIVNNLFVQARLEKVFVIKKTMQDIQEPFNNKETNNGYVTSLTDQINFLKEENKDKITIIQILSENQSYFSKQLEKQEFIFPKKVSQEKIKSNTQDLTTSNRFPVLTRENASNFQPTSLTIDLQEQSCTRKETRSLRENTPTPNKNKKSDKQNKDLSKRNSNSSRKISSKKKMKDKKIRKSRDVTVILSDSIIKDVKGWELTDDSNKIVVKSFRGATTSQIKWHEQNPKKIFLHYGTNDINDNSDPQNIAEEIVELTKSISKDCNSNVTVSGMES